MGFNIFSEQIQRLLFFDTKLSYETDLTLLAVY